jgi:hypothetical protein
MNEDEGLWVRSEVMPDGTYGVGLNVGADRSWALSRDRAVAYAVACFARATEVEHDTAVMRLLTGKLGIPAETAGQVIVQDLRPDRPDAHDATKPLRFFGQIGRAKHPRPDAGQFVPMLAMELDGKDAGQLTPADLRDHAGAVLRVIAAADLDAALLRALTGTFGLDENRSRNVIDDLANHWPDSQPPRRESES